MSISLNLNSTFLQNLKSVKPQPETIKKNGRPAVRSVDMEVGTIKVDPNFNRTGGKPIEAFPPGVCGVPTALHRACLRKDGEYCDYYNTCTCHRKVAKKVHLGDATVKTTK